MIVRTGSVVAAMVGVGLVALVSTAEAKERYTVTVSYVVGPERELPEGLEAVAVIDSGVQTTGFPQDEREQKWSTIAADMIEAMLYGGRQWGAPLRVAMRRETQRVLTEHDLRLAGLVEGDTATQAGKLLAVQGLITSRIAINVDVQKGRRSTIDWVKVMGGIIERTREDRSSPPRESRSAPPRESRAAPPRETRSSPQPPPDRARDAVARPRNTYRLPRYKQESRNVYQRSVNPTPRPHEQAPARLHRETEKSGHASIALATKEVEEIGRSLTVQCTFSLIDAVTGEAILQYSPAPYQKEDKASPHFLFGGSMDEADLDPVDHFIGELVERATQEFVGMIVPVCVEASVELVGKSKAGELGIRALRADEYQMALEQFEAWFRKENDHEAVFAMGVTCELMGDPQRAIEHYRQAVMMEDIDDEDLAVYMAAKNRLTRDIDRILRPDAILPAATQPDEP
ncbi:MAG: hypothetical protein JXA69_18375 [Phycisphaerae bacterium]|nr:hypothetical protein [Phycisphaerae bacterium]